MFNLEQEKETGRTRTGYASTSWTDLCQRRNEIIMTIFFKPGPVAASLDICTEPQLPYGEWSPLRETQCLGRERPQSNNDASSRPNPNPGSHVTNGLHCGKRNAREGERRNEVIQNLQDRKL